MARGTALRQASARRDDQPFRGVLGTTHRDLKAGTQSSVIDQAATLALREGVALGMLVGYCLSYVADGGFGARRDA